MAIGIEPALLRAWLTGRSLARGLPPPVADRGGFRIDTCSDTEISRWVFARPAPSLAKLARTIRAPRHLIKLCDTADCLRVLVPRYWIVRPTGYVMTAAGDQSGRSVPAGYEIDIRCTGAAVNIRFLSPDGDLAASGWAAETDDAFVYDRIVTEPAHRRRGLGGAMMTALRACKRDRDVRELLVATPDGRALYESLGWLVLSPYATASLADG